MGRFNIQLTSKEIGLNYSQALEAMLIGCSTARSGWDKYYKIKRTNKDEECKIMSFNQDLSSEVANISQADMLAEDWMVVDVELKSPVDLKDILLEVDEVVLSTIASRKHLTTYDISRVVEDVVIFHNKTDALDVIVRLLSFDLIRVVAIKSDIPMLLEITSKGRKYLNYLEEVKVYESNK